MRLAGATLGAMTGASLAVAMIGQALAQARGLVTKHAVKQVDRLLSNGGIDVWDSFARWVPQQVGAQSDILVAMDWTDFDHDGQSTLVLSLVTGHGRAAPLIWLSVWKEELADRRNDYEDACLVRLAETLPAGCRVTILADRGFGDQKLFAFLGTLGFDRVGARLVDPGNIVHAADTTGLVVINQVDPISVVFTLPEEAFQDVNRAINAGAGTHQALAVQAYPRNGTDLLGTGKLTLLNNQIDTTNGTVQLKGSFANPTHTLWPGQYVNVRLVLGQRANALTIPAAAVQRGPAGTFAYAVADDGKTAKMQPIEVAQIQDGVAIVDKGLSAGQKVVVDGQYKLKPGAVIAESARKGAAPASGAMVAENEAPAGAKK